MINIQQFIDFSWILNFVNKMFQPPAKDKNTKVTFPKIFPRFRVTEGRITQLIGLGSRLVDVCGDLIEYVFGARVRVQLLKICVTIPFFFVPGPPKWCTVKRVTVNKTKCLLYEPIPSLKQSDGLIVYIHGGGWCLGRPAFFDSIVFPLIHRTGVNVISVDYELAPKAKYPSQLNECEAVVKGVHDPSFELVKFDKNKVFVMGDSAGGNLAAVTCQRLLRQNLQHLVKSQILLYPITNLTDFQTPSYQYYERKYRKTAIIQPRIFTTLMLTYLGIDNEYSTTKNVLLNKHVSKETRESDFYKSVVNHSLIPPALRRHGFYDLPEHPEPDDKLVKQFEPFALNPEISPLLAKDLRGLPEAMIMTCGYDILRDDGVLYSKKLESDKVPVQWNHYDNAIHGILSVPMSKHSKAMMKDLVEYLKPRL